MADIEKSIELDGQRYRVRRSPVGGNGRTFVTYEVWEECQWEGVAPDHSMLRSEQTAQGTHWLGTVTSRRLPTDLEKLTGSERTRRVTRWQRANEAESYQAIERAFPQAGQGRKEGGRITTEEP